MYRSLTASFVTPLVPASDVTPHAPTTDVTPRIPASAVTPHVPASTVTPSCPCNSCNLTCPCISCNPSCPCISCNPSCPCIIGRLGAGRPGRPLGLLHLWPCLRARGNSADTRAYVQGAPAGSHRGHRAAGGGNGLRWSEFFRRGGNSSVVLATDSDKRIGTCITVGRIRRHFPDGCLDLVLSVHLYCYPPDLLVPRDTGPHHPQCRWRREGSGRDRCRSFRRRWGSGRGLFCLARR